MNNTNQNPNILNQVLNQLQFNSFTEAQKNTIIDWIGYLYGNPNADSNTESGSNIARGVFNQLISLNKTLNITEFTTEEELGEDGGFAARRGQYEVFVDFTNEFNEGYISETGTFVRYDKSKAFMHEVVHAIEGLTDNNNSRGYTSRQDSAGDTQHFTNDIHAELNAPLRISYDGRREVYGDNEESPNISAIQEGTEFTKNKLANGENPEIILGVFVRESNVDTSNNKPPTNDLLISGGLQGNKSFTTGKGNDYLYGGRGEDTLNSGEDDDYLYGGKRNDSLDGGTGEDIAEFIGKFEDYDYDKLENSEVITLDHVRGFEAGDPSDGTDTLKNIEWGIFDGKREELGISNLVSSEEGTAPRMIPLPLTDGVEATEFIGAIDTTPSPNPNDRSTDTTQRHHKRTRSDA